jgi:hypothetical protein
MNGDTGAGHRRKGLRGLAVLAVVALLTAACGGGSHPAGSGTGNPVNLAEALESWVHCLHGHGEPNVYLSRAPSSPNPGTTIVVLHEYAVQGANFDSPQFQAANKSCRHFLPITPPSTAELHQQFIQALKAARCMRTHGYPNWPDPSAPRTSPLGGVVNGNDIPPNIDTSAPQFQSAAKACGEAVPPGG